MKYEAGADIPEDDKKRVDQGLEAATETFFKYLSYSDFHSQINTSHQDMSLSTGCIIIEEGDDIDEPLLKISSIPLAELYIEPTSMARPHTFFRKHSVKAQEIMLKFPEAQLSDKQRETIARNPSSDVDIIDGGQVFNFEDKTYHQIVMWDDAVIFHQSYEKSAPGVIYRWSKVSGETHGRGPVDMAMADIRTVNKVKEYLLKNAALTLTPPLLGVSDSIFNPHSARIAPGTIMAVSSTDNLKALDVGGDLRVGQFVIEDLQANIRKIMFADPLGDITDPVRSATENIIRNQDMIKKRGANFGRFKSEFMVPFVNRCTDILVKRGKIAPIKTDGREVALKTTSVMGNAEQQENIDNALVYLNSLQALPPEEQRIGANLEAIPSFLVKNLNLPEELARSADQIRTIKEELKQAMAQQQQQGGQPIE